MCQRIGKSQLKQDEMVTIVNQSGMRAWNSYLFTFLDPLIFGVSRGQQFELEPSKFKHLDPLQQRIDALLGCQL